jgi:hypothetical protein
MPTSALSKNRKSCRDLGANESALYRMKAARPARPARAAEPTAALLAAPVKELFGAEVVGA